MEIQEQKKNDTFNGITSMSPSEKKEVAVQRLNELLARARRELKKKELEQIETTPEKYKYPFLKAIFGQSSPQHAIKMKCFECCCFENLNEMVGSCSVRICPIWSFRPLQKGEDA